MVNAFTGVQIAAHISLRIMTSSQSIFMEEVGVHFSLTHGTYAVELAVLSSYLAIITLVLTSCYHHTLFSAASIANVGRQKTEY
jgi:hypothetical protein